MKWAEREQKKMTDPKNPLPLFLSVVVVVKDQAPGIGDMLRDATRTLGSLVSDYELILIDNASKDETVSTLKNLTGESGLPNLQVYALTKQVDADTASWVGLENALGDYVAVLDLRTDDMGFLRTMLETAMSGSDVVFASNEHRPSVTLTYRMAAWAFNSLYKWFNGIHLAKDAPQYRILSKRVINFIQRHMQPEVTYRHLPATGGFSRSHLTYRYTPRDSSTKPLGDSVERGMRLLVSTTRGPMRLVTALAAFGAISNLLYSGYVVAVALTKQDVAPGWVTLSLQQSGMFLLISLVLLVLGEYILNMAALSNEGPRYHIAQEFTSSRILRRERLNIEEQPVLNSVGGKHRQSSPSSP
jgi:polyisoprenyl-phosphate glycosyltransferase